MAKVPGSEPRLQPATAGPVTRRDPTLTVDFAAGTVSNVAVLEIGRAGLTQEHADAYLRATNAPVDAEPSPGLRAFHRRMLTAVVTDPRWLDVMMSLFLNAGDPLDHLRGLRIPLVRIGHPPRKLDAYLANLIDEPGAVIGALGSASMQGNQLRADVKLIDNAPITGWPRLRNAILARAAEAPTTLGISIDCFSPAGGRISPVAADLVIEPWANLNGLLGEPKLPVSTIGRRPSTRFREEVLLDTWLRARMRHDVADALAEIAASAPPEEREEDFDPRLEPNRSCPRCGADFNTVNATVRAAAGDPSAVEIRCCGCGQWQVSASYTPLLPTGATA